MFTENAERVQIDYSQIPTAPDFKFDPQTAAPDLNDPNVKYKYEIKLKTEEKRIPQITDAPERRTITKVSENEENKVNKNEEIEANEKKFYRFCEMQDLSIVPDGDDDSAPLASISMEKDTRSNTEVSMEISENNVVNNIPPEMQSPNAENVVSCANDCDLDANAIRFSFDDVIAGVKKQAVKKSKAVGNKHKKNVKNNGQKKPRK